MGLGARKHKERELLGSPCGLGELGGLRVHSGTLYTSAQEKEATSHLSNPLAWLIPVPTPGAEWTYKQNGTSTPWSIN